MGLQESFLHPHDPAPNPFLHPPKAQTFQRNKLGERRPGQPNNWLTTIWSDVSLEPLQGQWSDYWAKGWHTNVTVSRDALSCQVFPAGEPDRFVVDDFSADGWNFLDESFEMFSRRVEDSFIEYSARIEVHRSELRENQIALRGFRVTDKELITISNSRDLEWRKFKRALAQYGNSAKEHKEAAMKDVGLVAAQRKPKLYDHLRSTIRYQIPNSSLATNPLVAIGKASGLAKTVDEVLALIGLEKRAPNKTGGRKPGSKNMYSSLALGR